MLDKELIKRSFSKAALTYEASSELQNEVADRLVAMTLERVPLPAGFSKNASLPIKILDLGCGTGRALLNIKKILPYAKLFGSDLAFPMLQKARENSVDINLINLDCESLPFADGSFDMAVSSLMYQWVPDTGLAFKEAFRVLARNGLFAFSTLGPGTLKELKECYNEAERFFKRPQTSMMQYASAEEIKEKLKEAGFTITFIEKRSITKTYKNLLELLKTLKDIGANNPSKQCNFANRALINEAQRVYSRKYGCAEGLSATYEAIDFICVK